MKSNPQSLLYFSTLGLQVPTRLDTDWYSANEFMLKMTVQYSNVKFIDLTANDLFNSLPFSGLDLIYYDKHHLNEIGSKQYGAVLINEFSKYTISK
jgi:hypothetical protein